ncbi:MAG: 16S rRNA (uracil(1498)-N(3))-methyltransferase [Blastocatellia bacterium]
METRRFYVRPDEITGAQGILDEAETHHLRDVVRLEVGNRIRVFDGVGNEFSCRIEEIERRKTRFSIIGPVPPESPESPLDLRIAAVLLKGDKLDIIVQKAVELGVRSFRPLVSERCDVRPDGISKRLQRWRRIALEATKQCGRAALMQIEDLISIDEFLQTPAAGDETRVMFSERSGRNFNSLLKSKQMTAIFGPEGGWDDRELEMAKNVGLAIITFGGRIMKADTAAIAISAILQNRFGDLN